MLGNHTIGFCLPPTAYHLTSRLLQFADYGAKLQHSNHRKHLPPFIFLGKCNRHAQSTLLSITRLSSLLIGLSGFRIMRLIMNNILGRSSTFKEVQAKASYMNLRKTTISLKMVGPSQLSFSVRSIRRVRSLSMSMEKGLFRQTRSQQMCWRRLHVRWIGEIQLCILALRSPPSSFPNLVAYRHIIDLYLSSFSS